MRKLFLLIVVMMTVLWSVKTVKGGSVWIDDVHIEPNQPTTTDSIVIIASGEATSGGVVITGWEFHREGTSLELNMFFSLGPFPAITPWSHSVVIGKLPADSYDLTVRAYCDSPAILTDTYLTSFTVVSQRRDFDCDADVDLCDFSVLALAWLSSQGDDNWNPACDLSEPSDNVIDLRDLAVFGERWLAGVK